MPRKASPKATAKAVALHVALADHLGRATRNATASKGLLRILRGMAADSIALSAAPASTTLQHMLALIDGAHSLAVASIDNLTVAAVDAAGLQPRRGRK